MKPTLAAFRSRSRIPGDPERLQAATRQFDKILLKRRDAECIADREVGRFAIGAIRANPKFPVFLVKCAFDSVLIEIGAIETSEHR